jgi:hypothetical protein
MSCDSMSLQVEVVMHAGLIAFPKKKFFPRLIGAFDLRIGRTRCDIRPWGGVAFVNMQSWLWCVGTARDQRLPYGFRLTTGNGPFFFFGHLGKTSSGFEPALFSFSEVTHTVIRGSRLGMRFGRLTQTQEMKGGYCAKMLSFIVSIPMRYHPRTPEHCYKSSPRPHQT